MKEHITFSVWIDQGESISSLNRLIFYYSEKNWELRHLVGSDSSWTDQSVSSITDIPPRERLEISSVEKAGLPIEAEFSRLAKGKSGKLEVRELRYGLSSMPCPWREHPIEVRIPVVPDHVRSARQTRPLLDELRQLCADIDIAWAIVTFDFRGPTLPELASGTRPSYIDLRSVYFSQAAFDESLVARAASKSALIEWPTGWFVSTLPVFGGIPESQLSEQEIWRLLVRWGRQRVYAQW